MEKQPFTAFRAPLKQLDLASCPDTLRRLFAAVFPLFFDKLESPNDRPELKRAWDDWQTKWGNRLGLAMTEPTLPRRYGAYNWSRGRYYSVCVDTRGNDGGTLLNELRAYREPVTTGMVEVMDLGLGNSVLVLGEREVRLERASELAVLIHDIKRMAGPLMTAPHELLEASDGLVKALARIPYRVTNVEVARTLDLRLPQSREWFATTFSKGNDHWLWPQQLAAEGIVVTGTNVAHPPQTITSLYQRQDGQAPTPSSFHDMLPTLLNPAIGGGDVAYGGFTLSGIGESLRELGVEGLVYPSARNDVYAIFDQGNLAAFGGWCFVDLRRREDEHRTAVLDTSPWSWVEMPPGVDIMLGKGDSAVAGSVRTQGTVARSRQEYLADVAASQAALDELGMDGLELTPREAFLLGSWMLRGMRLIALRSDPKEFHRAVSLASGLALRRSKDPGLNPQQARGLGGHVRHIYDRLGQLRGNAAAELLKLSGLFSSNITEELLRHVHDAALELELLRFNLEGARGAGHRNIEQPLELIILLQLPRWSRNSRRACSGRAAIWPSVSNAPTGCGTTLTTTIAPPSPPLSTRSRRSSFLMQRSV